MRSKAGFLSRQKGCASLGTMQQSHPTREHRRKTAAERQAQSHRAEARMIAKIPRALLDVVRHRGGALARGVRAFCEAMNDDFGKNPKVEHPVGVDLDEKPGSGSLRMTTSVRTQCWSCLRAAGSTRGTHRAVGGPRRAQKRPFQKAR